MPRNPRLTPRERGLLKGAIRRAFARSELHRQVLDAQAIEHVDASRPRVRNWCWCADCGVVTPRWQMTVDHIAPIIPVNSSFEEMSLDEVVDRSWCPLEGLQGLCPNCHSRKTKAENKERREHKKAKKSIA